MHRVCFSGDGSLLATAAGDQYVVVREVDTDDVWHVHSQDGNVSALAFLPGGKRLATGDMAGNVRFWNISRPEKTDLGELTHALDVKYSPDGGLLATSSVGVVHLFDANSEELVAKLEPPLDQRQADRHVISRTRAPICFSHNGRLLAAGNGDYTATIYDVDARKPLHVLREHTSVIQDITFSPGGKQVVTACSWGKKLRFWDPSTGFFFARQDRLGTGEQRVAVCPVFSERRVNCLWQFSRTSLAWPRRIVD